MDYETKRELKIERLRDMADKYKRESTSRFETARKMQSIIPFGQPILVGHHSEKRDRNYRKRIDGQWDKAGQAGQKAEYYAQRAAAAEANTAIFSEDPKCVEKLEEKLARLEKQQELMVKANKLVKKKDTEGLKDLGFSDKAIVDLFTPDFCGRTGFPSYRVSNNRANITRLKERVQLETKKASDETSEYELNGVTVVENVEENRIQLFFPGKPELSVREKLKSAGFRFSYTNGAWQRHRSSSATYLAKQLVEGFTT